MKVDYSVEFPPGPMGLELEPLIRSAEREIGCRVKDYYFALDHDGVNQSFLESKVKVGDIISYVDGQDVRSLPFVQIVDLLKSLKAQKKTIWFKNISAQWKDAEGHSKKKSGKSRDPTLSPRTPPKDANTLSLIHPDAIKVSPQVVSVQPSASGAVPQDSVLALSPIMPTKSRPPSSRKSASKPPPAFTFSPSATGRKQMPPTATELALLSPPVSRVASDCVLSTPLTPSSVRRLSLSK
eukprot:gene42179-51505_t